MLHHVTYICHITAKDVIKETDQKDSVDPEKTKENECPLCQEKFGTRQALEDHAISSHMTNPEVLVRLRSQSAKVRKMYDLLTEEQKRYIDQENDVSSHPSADGLGTFSN